MRGELEQSRAETQALAAQTAQTLSNALQVVERSFAAQRARDIEAMAASNRVTLTVASIFGCMGLLTLVGVAYFQWRMSRELSEITAAFSCALGLNAGASRHALPPPVRAIEAPPAGVQSPTEGEKHSSGQEKHVPTASTPRSNLQMLVAAQAAESLSTRRAGAAPAGTPKGGGGAAEIRFFPTPLSSLRKRRVRALRTAVIVGLMCAAALALLFYLTTSGASGSSGWIPRVRH